MKISLSLAEVREYLEIPSTPLPKYVAPLLNLANQFAQGTRPDVVGQMSELLQDFPGRSVQEWRKWYLHRYPSAIRDATEKITAMVANFRHAMEQIDREVIERWVEDLVILKTFVGLRFHEAILKKVAELRKTSYRLAERHEETKGIDGFVGGQPVTIKPATYKSKPDLTEEIQGEILYYSKTRNKIEIELQE